MTVLFALNLVPILFRRNYPGTMVGKRISAIAEDGD